MIPVTKPFLPPLKDYVAYLDRIWSTNQVTNNGPLLLELEQRLSDYLGVRNLFIVSNGTVALQLALKALGIEDGEVITTPFSYVATTSSLIWERCTPVFADIEARSFCIDPREVEKKITPRTRAIMATHVYGFPCEHEALNRIAKTHGLKIIYDGAHAFGVRRAGKSVLAEGDVSTLSFHATKLFHMGEGGAVIVQDDEVARQLKLYRSFGHIGDDYYVAGINGKNSELHAAMGLAVLQHMPEIATRRAAVAATYDTALKNTPGLSLPPPQPGILPNHSYYPVLFESEAQLLKVKAALEAQNIFTRRYFYPSLNTLPYVAPSKCPVSEDVATRVLCLPIYAQLEEAELKRVVSELHAACRAS